LLFRIALILELPRRLFGLQICDFGHITLTVGSMADSRVAVAMAAASPHWLIFFKKPPFSVKRHIHILLCAFAINKVGADKLSSAPDFSKILDQPLSWLKVGTVVCTVAVFFQMAGLAALRLA